MPMAAALVASAFSISGGMSAIGAVGATVGQTILGGMMVAGGALSGIGAITGNSKLMKIGGVLGLAGGVGNLINEGMKVATTEGANQVLQNGAKSTVGNTIADSTGTAVGASEAAKAAASTAGDLGAFNDAAGNGLVSGAGGPSPVLAGADQAATGGIASSPLDARLASGAATANTSPGFMERLANGVSSNAAGDAMTGLKNTAGTLWDGAKNVIGDVGSWAEANPTTAKIGGGLVYGAMDGYNKQEQMKQMFAQRKKYDEWVAQRYNASVANLQIPAPFSTPGQQPGIIAGSRG